MNQHTNCWRRKPFNTPFSRKPCSCSTIPTRSRDLDCLVEPFSCDTGSICGSYQGPTILPRLPEWNRMPGSSKGVLQIWLVNAGRGTSQRVGSVLSTLGIGFYARLCGLWLLSTVSYAYTSTLSISIRRVVYESDLRGAAGS